MIKEAIAVGLMLLTLQVVHLPHALPVDGHTFSPLELWERAILARPASKNHSDRVHASTWDTTLHDGRGSFGGSPVYMSRPQEGTMNTDKIVELPGQPQLGVDFDQYSGYVTVDPEAGRALFYYFVESTGTSRTASEKPLVLWLNGGPGCSSIGAGAMMELGPFRVQKDGKTLRRNAYSWNQLANIIFLESPAGVGFSYSNNTSDYEQGGDKRTAEDSYTFLVNWLERFPQYKARDLYITGESYAGHYVPQLADEILRNSRIGGARTVINLRGIAVGNGLVDYEALNRGFFDYLLMRTLISDEAHDAVTSTCNFSATAQTFACRENAQRAEDSAGNIYGYDIYAPLCNQSSLTPISKNIAVEQVGPNVDPCSQYYVATYLNNPTVQKSLHAEPTNWTECNLVVRRHWSMEDFVSPILPVIKRLMASGIRVWMYSGDTDPAVPVTSGKYAIKKLNLSVETPWYPWYSQGEVGGYAEGYTGLAFVTVRGSGHFVPTYQPARALTLFSAFLEGKLPPPA